MSAKYSDHPLPGGPRLGHAQLINSECAALSIYIPVGSRDEIGDTPAGLAHFSEHMAFKGTNSRSAKELTLAIESGGGQANACTSEDHTVYEATGEAEFLPTMIDVICDMVWRSTFPENEIDLERDVIEEEITMIVESPTDHIGDVLAKSIYPNHPLGQPISGSSESIAKINKATLHQFAELHHFRSDIVIATSGPMPAEEVLAQLLPKLPPEFRQAPLRLGYDFSATQSLSEQRATDQLQLGMGWLTGGRKTKHRHALRLLSLILGESSSSRLFNELREERGLCYQVGSEISLFDETGALQVIAGLDHESKDESIEVILQQTADLAKNGPALGELDRAKRLAIAQSKLAFESTSSHAAWVGEGLLFFDDVTEPSVARDKLLAVTDRDIQEIAKEIFAADPAMALIEPES